MKNDSTGKVILKTAMITTAAILIVCLAVAVIVFFCFPYEGYKFFSDLGMKKNALFFAERYEDRDNIDGLIYCVSISDELLDSTGKKKFADKLKTYTEKYFEYDDAFEYFAQLDSYYIQKAVPKARVGLYSHNEYVVSRNFKARAVLGEDDKMLFRGELTAVNDLFKGDVTLDEQAAIYSAVYEQLRLGRSSFYIDEEQTALAQFYYDLGESVAEYIYSLELVTDKLHTLFLMRNVINLISGAKAYFQDVKPEAYDYWNAFLLNYTYNGKPLTKAYTDLLSEYIEGEKA